MNYSRYTYLTCQEFIDKYPSVKLWGWNNNKIGVFYNCLLIDGRKFGNNSRTIITESSILKLMLFVENQVKIIDPNPDYMTYQEIMDVRSRTILYRWSPTIIGILCNSGLLQGKRSSKEAQNLVSVQSVVRLIEFSNQRFQNYGV